MNRLNKWWRRLFYNEDAAKLDLTVKWMTALLHDLNKSRAQSACSDDIARAMLDILMSSKPKRSTELTGIQKAERLGLL